MIGCERTSLSGHGRWRFAVGDQGVNILNREPRIRLVETDRGAVCASRKVNELLQVLAARRRRRVFGELEDEIKHLSDVLGKIGDVFVERAVIDGKKSNLVVLKRNELGEVRRADLIQIFSRALAASAQDQLHSDEMKV